MKKKEMFAPREAHVGKRHITTIMISAFSSKINISAIYKSICDGQIKQCAGTS